MEGLWKVGWRGKWKLSWKCLKGLRDRNGDGEGVEGRGVGIVRLGGLGGGK